MSMDQTALAEACSSVASLSREAMDWLRDPQNAETVGPERDPALHRMRRGARRAERLARAARSKLSVSVFGPSQAGKSFLVSVLARPAEGRLTADFSGPDGQLDYIREVNPEGEGESTGLVTRFTMTRAAAPEGFPIPLVLLSEADVARIFINSFFMDGDRSEPVPTAEDLKAHVARFQPRMGPAEVPGLEAEDVLEIGEYIENTKAFARTAYATGVVPFKTEAALMAPRMAIRDRAEFLSVYWGGHRAFTDLYVTLCEALAQLGHDTQVHARRDALVPREHSIIDVKTLHGMFGGGEDGTLELRTGTGNVVALPRAVVCALAAELVFPMLEQPSPLFASTDLLDFPGARNRFEKPLSVSLAEPEKTVTQLLLRGKVAYLFDRYVENQDITSMLLCVPDSNMDTVDLPGLVDNWIALTHGATPAQRAATECILFFVMTKFDKHLGESAAGGGDTTRFERRMHASLLENFGQSNDNWVKTWAPGQAFRNCYWLRNPNYFVEGLIEYDGDQREAAIRDSKLGRLEELRSGCLAAESVQAHFADPAAAWDAALALNDGGVGYLTARLASVCTPEGKTRQIASQLAKVLGDLQSAVGGYYVSDDIAKRIEEKRAEASAIIDALELTLQGHRFGAFLNRLTVDQEKVEDLLARVPSSIRISSAVSSAGQPASAAPPRPAAPGPARPGRPARTAAAAPAPSAAAAPAEEPANGGVRTMSPEQFQVETAFSAWMDALAEFREDESGLGIYGLSPNAAASLTGEMVHGFRRLGLLGTMTEELRAIGYGLTLDRQAPAAAILCAERINGFVSTLGTERLPEAERPQVELADGSLRTVFAPRPAADSADTLPLRQRATSEETWTDWVFALDTLYVGNAKDSESGAVNIEQNMRLGGILTGFEAARETTRD
ncbi:virulence factor SrfC family protein [Mangrovicoccus sp. HB161399]|uniref:virulence factor SrfC family protein n=1 Tax=Mangrovicoccus sp. HB161399 TaxID=2720392 RepID=UPI0020A69767|nr:virulence factor SrfC family protein [Mangrovicoccus sp. HB161399]